MNDVRMRALCPLAHGLLLAEFDLIRREMRPHNSSSVQQRCINRSVGTHMNPEGDVTAIAHVVVRQGHGRAILLCITHLLSLVSHKRLQAKLARTRAISVSTVRQCTSCAALH